MAQFVKNTSDSAVFNYYLKVNIDNICRLCLERSTTLLPIFDPIKPPHLSILIMSCASVKVFEGDGMPANICHKCIAKLNLAFQFKSECEAADTKFRQHYKDFSVLSTKTDLNYCYIEIMQENVIITETEQNEAPEKSMTDEVFVQAINFDNSINVNEENSKYLDLDATVSLTPTLLSPINLNQHEICKDNTESSQIESNYVRNRTNDKKHQCDSCGKIFNAKGNLVLHNRTHTGERPFSCKLCNKRFINGGHLHTHMRTHTGERKHACVSCTKAFATAQQLTKHTITVHTAQRPHACAVCPKRFANPSNLRTHVKCHTGEKEYQCDKCPKSFCTKSQLFQHMLVHTGEKSFLCEYCDKMFAQKSHLLRHIKKLHVDTVKK